MHFFRSIVTFTLLTLFLACAHNPDPIPVAHEEPGAHATGHKAHLCSGHHSLDATLWVRTSAEFQSSTLQTFRHASWQLEKALADPTWTAALEQDASQIADLPSAIIVDVDETILDNSPFQAGLIASGQDYSTALWNSWANKSAATALQGARDFLNRAEQLGITIFYVTNREAETEAATKANLLSEQLPFDETRDVLLMKGENGWTSDKAARRQKVAATHRILLLLGDDLNDFVSGAKTTEPGPRRELANTHKSMWGTRWFVLSNPTYGSWEASLYSRSYDKSEEEKQLLKARYLSPAEP